MSKIRYVTLALSIILLVLYLHFSEGFESVFKVLRGLDYKFFFLALLLTFIATVLDAYSKYYLRRKYQKCPFHWTLYAHLFQISPSNLIPGILQGGTACEVTIYQKQGLEFSQGTSILLVKSVVGFTATCLVTIFLYFHSFSFFNANTNALLKTFFAIGFILNFLSVLLYAFVGRFDKLLFQIAKAFIILFSKMGLIKDKEKSLSKTKDQLFQLKMTMKNLGYKAKDWFFILFLALVGNFLGYFTSYLLSLALYCKIEVSLWAFFTAICITSNVSAVLPIPGGLGATDLAYSMVLRPIVGDKITFLLLLWRVVTFYFPLSLSSITMMFKVPCKKEDEKKIEKTDVEESKYES